MSFAHRGRIFYKLFQLTGTNTKWYIKLTVRSMPWVDRFKCTLHNGNFLPVGFKVVQNFTTAMSLSLFGRTLNSVLNAKSSNLLRQKFKTSNRYKRNSVLNKLTFLQSDEWTKKLQKLSQWLEVFQCVLYSGTEPLLYGKLCFRHTIGQFAVSSEHCTQLLIGPSTGATFEVAVKSLIPPDSQKFLGLKTSQSVLLR